MHPLVPDAVTGAHPAGGTAVMCVRQRRVGLLLDLLVFALCSVVWSLAGFHLYAGYGSGMDLSIFDQAIRNLAHLHAPVSSMKTPGMNLWGDHLHPVIILAAPLYWVWDDPRVLLVGQAMAIGWGAVILMRCARRQLGHGWWAVAGAFLVGLCFVCGTGVQSAVVFDVHEVAFGVPLLAWALSSWVDRRWNRATVLLLCFLLVKEDAPVIVAGCGVAFLVQRQWRRGLLLVVAAVAWLEVATKLVIPALSPTGQWAYAGKVHLTPHVLATNLHHSLGTPGPMPAMLVVLVLTAGALAVLSPLSIPVIPVVVSRAIVDKPEYWGYGYHYNLLPSLLLAFATLDALRHFRRGTVRRLALAAMTIALLLRLDAGLRASQAVQAVRTVDHVRERDGNAAVAQVPAGEPVASDVYVTNHLTHAHPVVMQLAPPAFVDDFGRPVLPAVRWVVLDDRATLNHSYPSQPGWVSGLERRLVAEGWTLQGRHGEFEVYRRP